MPGRRCAIFGCNNSKIKTKKNAEPIIFHNFPPGSDMLSIMIRNDWIQRCRRSDKFNPLTSQICSIHFTDIDYERDLQNELLGLPVRKKLKKTAVPTLCLPQKQKVNDSKDSARNERQKKRERKSMINKILCDIPENGSNETNHQSFEPEYDLNTNAEQKSECNCNIPKHSDTEYQDLFKKYEDMKKENESLKKSYRQKIKSLNNQLSYYKNKNKQLRSKEKSVVGVDLLKQVLTDNQIAVILKKKKRINWTRDEIAVAFTLRYYSKRAYLFLRNKLNFPLPGLSSLRRWASKINMSEGILNDVLTFLEVAGEGFNDFEKTVILQFDEVKIKTVMEYDVAKDEVIGPFNQMQVCMARGLFAKWKQPVFVAFDQKMTIEILHEIIRKLHEINYNVMACVSDCGGSNVGLWKEFGIDTEKTYFAHPQTGKNIYMFADAPHLLKLLRNWLLDKGFLIGDKKINKTPLECLVFRTDKEVNTCYKISNKHVTCEKSQRQNVLLAAELLSNTVGEALIRYKPGPSKKLAEDVGEFICDIDKWFDIFNSYVEEDPLPCKSGYGKHLQLQNEHLDKVTSIISNMRAEDKSVLQTFQKGMLMSIKSLKSLYQDAKETFNIQYICTHKLNQDSLENFFSQLRSRGPNEHPSPLEAIKRMRMIILGKNPGILDAKVNTVDRIHEEYIVAKVMDAATVTVDDAVDVPTTATTAESSSGSSFSSSNSSQNQKISNNNMPETTHDALEYIAGYLAKKFKGKIENLGDITAKIKNDHSYNLPSWVQQLSYGGLIKPSKEWLQSIVKWNSYFEIFHKDTFRKGPYVTRRLAEKIKKRDPMPIDLIKAFCKLRLIIRMNYRNIKSAEEKAAKGKKRKLAIINDNERKTQKKMKKIIN